MSFTVWGHGFCVCVRVLVGGLVLKCISVNLGSFMSAQNMRSTVKSIKHGGGVMEIERKCPFY